MNAKPIETEYNGYLFRSRLEARWAVFFDALGVKYEYEPEGFRLPSGKQYLPDFRVQCWGTRGSIGDKPFDLWIEVKGKMTPQDAAKIREFNNSPNCETCKRRSDRSITDPEQFYKYCFEVCFKRMNPILIVGNIPTKGDSSDSSALKVYERMDGCDIYPFNYETIDGDHFGAYPAAFEGKFFLWGDDGNYIWNDSEVEVAYTKARQARFEHGEKP